MNEQPARNALASPPKRSKPIAAQEPLWAETMVRWDRCLAERQPPPLGER